MLEIIRSDSVTAIGLEQLPQIQLEKARATKIYLNEKTKNAVILTTACEAALVMYPKKNEKGQVETFEYGIPYVFST